MSGTAPYDQTYLTNVSRSSSTTQCIDFYYYIPERLNNAKIQVGWKTNTQTHDIVELVAEAESKWLYNQITFTAPSASSYQVSNRVMFYLSI